MGLVLVHVQVRAAPGLFHKGLEFFGSGNRDQFVLVAEEHDGGRNALANVVHGGNFFPSVLDPIVTVALGAIVVDGVEQDKGIGFGGDRCILTVLFEAGNRPCRRGHVATGRTAARSQSFRVDPKLLGIFPNPAYGRLPVLDAFEGGCLACFLPCSPQSSRPFPSRPGIHSGGQIERGCRRTNRRQRRRRWQAVCLFGRYGLWDRKR